MCACTFMGPRTCEIKAVCGGAFGMLGTCEVGAKGACMHVLL
jgi:hypothetical protein